MGLFPEHPQRFITPCCDELMESLVSEVGENEGGMWECPKCGRQWVVTEAKNDDSDWPKEEL